MRTIPELPNRQPSFSDQVYEIIVNGISNGTYPPGSLLPSENQLAESYNVSRSTIRAAFARLVEQGFVKRQRGVGTFVAEFPSLVNPLFQLLDAHERIVAQGFKPGFKQIISEIIEIEGSIAEKLSVEVGSLGLHVQKVFTANDEPIILFVNYIPLRVFQDHLSVEQVLKPGATEPFFEFFAKQCNNKVKYLTSVINPEIAKNCQFPDIFNFIDSYTPVLVIEDIGYDDNDAPIFLSMEYLVREASSFQVIRFVENF